MAVRKLASNAGYIVVSTASLALMQWAIMAIISRIDGPAALGYYALGQAFATPFSYLAWLGLRQQYLVSGERDFTLADVLFLRIMVTGTVFAGVLAFIGWYYNSKPLTYVAAGVLAVKFAEGLFDLVYGPLQHAGNSKRVATTSVARTAASLVFFTAIYLGSGHLPIALVAVALMWILLFVVQRGSLWPAFPWRELWRFPPGRAARLKGIVSRTIWLGIGTAVMSFAGNAPRFVIERNLGVVDLGYFAACFHFFAIGLVVVGSLGHAMLPTLAGYVQKLVQRAFWKLLFGVVLVLHLASGLAGLMAMWIGNEVMRVIYGPAFAGQGYLLVWVAFVAGPIYSATILTTGLQAFGKNRSFLAVQLVVLVTNILITQLLIAKWGIAAGYLGLLAGGVVQCVIAIVMLLRAWRDTGSAPPAAPAA